MAALLASLGKSAAAQQTPPAQPYETFVISRADSAAEAEKKLAASRPAQSSSLPFAIDRTSATAVLTVFPGRNDLNITASGRYNGSNLYASFSPLRLLNREYEGAGFLEVGNGARGIRLGDNQSAGDGMIGLRLFSPFSSASSSLGGGIYLSRSGTSQRFIFAADAAWNSAHSEGRAMLGVDGSWQARHKLDAGPVSLAASLSRDSMSKSSSAELSSEIRVTHTTSAYGRVANWGAGSTWAFGLMRRSGGNLFSADTSNIQGSGGSLRQAGLGALFSTRTGAMAFRFQRLQVAASASHSQESENRLSATAYFNRRSGLTTWGGLSAAMRSTGAFDGYLTAGASRSFGGRWDYSGELSFHFSGGITPQLSIGCQVTPDWKVQLLGGSPFGSGSTGCTFGFQLSRRFSVDQPDAGRLTGQAFIDGKACHRIVKVTVDGIQSVQTDKEGRFTFNRLPSGQHSVQLDTASLPLDLDIDQSPVSILIRRGRSESISLKARAVGSLQGTVKTLPDAFGTVDPSASPGIVVLVAGSRKASVDANGAFNAGSLAPGHYVVSLDASTLPPDYMVVGSTTFEVDIVSGGKPPKVEFTIGPKRRVEFTDLTSANSNH